MAGKVKAHISTVRRQVDHISQDVNARTRILSDTTGYLRWTETEVNDMKQEPLQAKEVLGWLQSWTETEVNDTKQEPLQAKEVLGWLQKLDRYQVFFTLTFSVQPYYIRKWSIPACRNESVLIASEGIR